MVIAKALQETVVPFMKESTIGGLNNSARSGSRHWIWRVYWLTIFTVGVILTIIQVHNIVKEYYEYHVAVNSDLIYEPALQFPAVTVCNLNRVNCVILYNQLNRTKYELMSQNLSSLQDEVNQLHAMLVQVGCDEQMCSFWSSSTPDVRGIADYDWMVQLQAMLQCQNIFVDQARLYINNRNCYYLYQMLHYDPNYANNSVKMSENQNDWSLANCSLQAACAHYTTKIMPLVDSGAFYQEYTTGAEIGSVCGGNATGSATKKRKKREAANWLDLLEASYKHNISLLQDEFLIKYLSMDESLRTAIGHQFPNTYMSTLLSVENGMVATCSFLGEDCKNEDLWYQFNDPTYGNCFTFNSANNKSGNRNSTTIRNATLTGASSGLQLELFVDQLNYMIKGLSPQAGFRIVVHDPQAYPLMDDDGLDLQPGSLSSIAVQLINISRMPDPFESHCFNHWNQTTLNQSIMTDNKPQYSITVCNRFCIQVEIIFVCDCYHIQLDMTLINISKAHFQNESRPCSLLPNATSNPDYACFQEVLKSFEEGTKQCDSCNLACAETVYSTTSSTSMWPSSQYWITLARYEQFYDDSQVYDPVQGPFLQQFIQTNYLKAEIYYQTLNVQQIVQSPKVSGSDLYANLGGALALYLGLAIIMFFEFVELTILLSIAMYQNYKGIEVDKEEQEEKEDEKGHHKKSREKMRTKNRKGDWDE